MVKIWLSSLHFVDDFPKNPLTGGYGHIDGIKAHLYDDFISIELWSTFCIQDSIQSREIQQCWAGSLNLDALTDTAPSEPILKVDHLIGK